MSKRTGRYRRPEAEGIVVGLVAAGALGDRTEPGSAPQSIERPGERGGIPAVIAAASVAGVRIDSPS